MTKITSIINTWIIYKIGYGIFREYPRRAIRFAKKYFNGKSIKCIEIGIFDGRHAIEMQKHLNIEKFYLIDSYLKYEEYNNDEYADAKKIANAKKIAYKRMGKYDNIIWIEKFSSEAIKDIKEKVDFIYIDGNHNYKYVLEDLENYYDLVKDGGIVSGHDIDWEDVSKAVIEFTNKKNIQVYIKGTDWWFIK